MNCRELIWTCMQKYLYAHLKITTWTGHAGITSQQITRMEFHYNSGGRNAGLWKCIWQAWLSVHYVALRETWNALLWFVRVLFKKSTLWAQLPESVVETLKSSSVRCCKTKAWLPYLPQVNYMCRLKCFYDVFIFSFNSVSWFKKNPSLLCVVL